MAAEGIGYPFSKSFERNKNLSIVEIKQKIADVISAVDLTGNDIAVAHLQAAFDVLTGFPDFVLELSQDMLLQ